MNTKTLNVSINYFGDTVLTFVGEERGYSMFQHNCTYAKELYKRVTALIVDGTNVFISDGEESLFTIIPAMKYIEDLILLNDEVNKIREYIPLNDSAGAEICGHYGY